MTPVAQVPCLFRRCRLFAASQRVEELTDYGTQAAVAAMPPKRRNKENETQPPSRPQLA